VEDHVSKQYAILAHSSISLLSVRISMPERRDRYARAAVSEESRL
jgi:hypothetical protein